MKMFLSDSIMPFVFYCIFVLIIINAVIFLATLFLVIRQNSQDRNYSEKYDQIYPYVLDYIENDNQLDRLKAHINYKNFLNRKIIIDILISYSQSKNINLSKKFIGLGYDKWLLEKAKKEKGLTEIKMLGLAKISGAFEILIINVDSYDFEIKYASFYALSLLKLNTQQLNIYIKKLIESGIQRDRIIEMIDNLQLDAEACLEFLEKQKEEKGKVIFIRVLESRGPLLAEQQSDQIVRYLKDTKEIRISTVLALASTKNSKYFSILLDLYDRENKWEVRSAITKSMKNFSSVKVLDALRKMTNDKAWWVRFHAVEIMARKGNEGVEALIDISLENNLSSGLAYHALNANAKVYETVKAYKGVQDD